MCPIPNGFRDRAISLYSSKIVAKKEILRTISNISIYCSSDKVNSVALTLKHTASVKCFVSLQFLNPKTTGRTPWIG
jgi:hypothetical protein